MQNKIIRIFVSSTFSDFEFERNELAKKVFPYLENYCCDRGFSFQVIDLRWGISEQDGYKNRTLKICLDEIARCQRLSPRPNFLVLAGHKYGWRPLPSAISLEDWTLLTDALSANDRRMSLLQRWYKQDFNQIQTPYLLSRSDDAEFTEQVKEELAEVLFTLAQERIPATSPSMIEFGLSATEQEIYHGLFQKPEAKEHTLVLLRDYKKIGEQETADERALRLQEKLLQFTGADADQLIQYSPEDSDYLKEARDFLEEVISKQIKCVQEEINTLSLYQIERITLDAHLNQIGQSYVDIHSRADNFLDFCAMHRGNCVLVTGTSGSGKSTLLKYCASRNLGHIIAAFGDGLLYSSSILHAVWFCTKRLEEMKYIPNPGPEPDYKSCAEWLQDKLSLLETKEPLMILLDSADQFRDWKLLSESILQIKIPSNVTLVVSCISRDSLSDEDRMAEIAEYSLNELPKEDTNMFLEALLRQQERRLTEQQWETLQNNLPDTASPLYLKLLCSQCMELRSNDKIHFGLSKDAKTMIRGSLQQLEELQQLPVYKMLGYIALAQDGLAEEELIGLLKTDRSFRRQLHRISYWEIKNLRHTISALWIHLYYSLQIYLRETVYQGIPLLCISHSLVREVILEELDQQTQNTILKKIRSYFGRQRIRSEDDKGTVYVNIRKLRELFPACAHLEDWETISTLLESEDYVDAYIRSNLYKEIVQQFLLLEQKKGLTQNQQAQLSLLRTQNMLLCSWKNSYLAAAAGEGICQPEKTKGIVKAYLENPEAVRKPKQKYSAQRIYVPGISSNAVACRDHHTLAILDGNQIRIFDGELQADSGIFCKVNIYPGFLYWYQDRLILRSEYCRITLIYTGKELYVEKMEDCKSWDPYLDYPDDEDEKIIEKIGGWTEADAIRNSDTGRVWYYTEEGLKHTELFYPQDMQIKIFQYGRYAAIITDRGELHLDDLEREARIGEYVCGDVKKIAWASSGREILVIYQDDYVEFISFDPNIEGKPLPGPSADMKSYLRQRRMKESRREWERIYCFLMRNSFCKDDIPLETSENPGGRKPLLAAFSIEYDWLACYYYYYNKATVRIYSLSSRTLQAECYVDPIFRKDSIKSAFYASEDGSALLLVSRGIYHRLDIASMQWSVEKDIGKTDKEEIKIKIRTVCAEHMRQWLPHKAAEYRGNSVLTRQSKVIQNFIYAVAKVIIYPIIKGWYVPPIDEYELMSSRLDNLPVYQRGNYYWAVDLEHRMVHVCDKKGNFLCHEQFDFSIAAVDIVGNLLYILPQNLGEVQIRHLILC